MSGDDSSLSLRAPVRETVFRPFPLASPSGALYIERMFFLQRCINQPIHYLRLYRSLYSNSLDILGKAQSAPSVPRNRVLCDDYAKEYYGSFYPLPTCPLSDCQDCWVVRSDSQSQSRSSTRKSPSWVATYCNFAGEFRSDSLTAVIQTEFSTFLTTNPSVLPRLS